MQKHSTIMEKVLIDIRKPGRYIDSEWNAIHKGQRQGMLRVALCFPDIYEIGMSHLGMKILYGALNREDDVLCERVFAPWIDMESKMRAENGALRSPGSLMSSPRRTAARQSNGRTPPNSSN